MDILKCFLVQLENINTMNYLCDLVDAEPSQIRRLSKLMAPIIEENLDLKMMSSADEEFRVSLLEEIHDDIDNIIGETGLDSDQIKILTSKLDSMIPNSIYKEKNHRADKKLFRRINNRYDGRRLKTISPFIKIIPYIMTRRSDAQVFSKVIIQTENIREYIKDKREKDFKITYLHLFIAVYVRVMAERPQLNRFVMNNRLYARNNITISLAIKRTLKDSGEETTIKFPFTGRENIFQVAEIVNNYIADSVPVGTTNRTDKIANRVMSLPNIIVKTIVGILKQMDKWNIMPGSIIEASPFHTSLFFTYLKSIKLDYVYHHIYDFGTTGMFISLGREKKGTVVEKDEIKIKRICEMGITIDERICDGLYFANSLKLIQRYLSNPYLLETNLKEIVEDVV